METALNKVLAGSVAADPMPLLDTISHRSQDSATSALCSQWPINLKLTHLDLNTEASLIHFQGHYLTLSDLDYSILQVEIQNTPKTKASVEVGEFCLVQDLISGQWYRGQVQHENADTFDVFLIDHGNVLSVDVSQISSCSNDLFDLPPKIICGFFSNVLPLQDCWDSAIGNYLFSLIGKNVTGYIHALLPHKVLIFEATDINKELVRLGFGKHVDTDTFLLLVQLITEVHLEQNMKCGPDLIQKPKGQNDSKSLSLKGLKEVLSFCGTKMSAGTCIQLKVTAAVNPGLFYCQLSSAASDLQEMSERLTAACNSMLSNPNQTPQDNLGLLCSVKGKDGKWYRGFVQCLPVNSHVQVFFVDYGFCELIRVENIHRLPHNCLSLPIMAFPCMLSSLIEHKDWKQRQLCLLKKGILSGVLNAKILSLDVKRNTYLIEILCNKDHILREPELPLELSRLNHEAVFKCALVLPHGDNFCSETVKAHVSSVQAEGLTTGSNCVGYVVHVINPSNFSLRTEKRNSEFEDLMKQISEHFSQVQLNEQVLENPQLGTMCFAMYEHDMHFYRAVVKHKLDHGAVVLFIDFGNTEKVPYMQIKKIPKKFVSQAAFALSCSLGNIMPLTDVWTSASSQFFRRAVSNRSLLVHVIHQRKDKIVVDLFTTESKTNQSITELLISSKLAESWKYTQSESVKQDKIVTSKRTPCKPKELSAWTQHQKLIPRDEKGVVSKIKKMLPCTLNQKVTPKPQEPVIKILQLRLGCEMPVRCTHIKHPSDFWCQVSHNLSALEQLMAKIQQYYSTHTVPIHVGAIFCIAKSPEDGKWYRACITERKGLSHVGVLLVDNGTTLQVEEHKLQQILPEYSELEAQAFRCSLYNLIEPIDPKSCGEWNTEECTLLRDFVQDHSVSLTCSLTRLLWVTGKGLCTVVDLHSSQVQHSITELLIGQGLARPVIIQSKSCFSAFPVSFSYSSFNLSCGNKEQVYITHVSNTWEIYCQLDRNSKIIEELETKISEEEKIRGSDAASPVDGMCLAKYFDKRWYRGLAKPVQSSLHLAVFFVDYGNACIVEKTNVLSIPNHSAELLYTPMQAVRCSLAHVPKMEPLAWVTQWLKKTLLNELVRAVVVGKLEDGSATVELFLGDVNINNKINEHIDNLTQTKGNLPPVSNKPKAVIKGKSLNSQQQGKRVSPTLNTDVKHQITEMPTLSSLPNTRIKPGLKDLFYASHINTVGDFFLQLQEDETNILNMRDVLNSSVSRASLVKSTPRELDINNCVLAEYDDGDLYRAVIKGSEGNRFKVEFLDYGNVSFVRKEKIYSMTGKLICQPRLSIPCSLLDTSAYEKDHTFRDAITGKPLRVEFVCWIGKQWKVKIEILEEKACLSVPVPDGAVEPSSEPTKQEGNDLNLSLYATKAELMKSSYLTKEGHKPQAVTVSTKDKILVTDSSDRPTKSKMCLQEPDGMPDNRNASLNNRRTSESSDVRRDIVDAFRPPTKVLGIEPGVLLSALQNGHFSVRLNTTGIVVKGPKDSWSRAAVMHVDETEYMTFLLDHGLTKESCSSLRQFHSDHAHISGLTLLCKLNSPICVVTQFALESLRRLVGKDLKLLFMTHSESDNLWLLEIALNQSLIQQAEITNCEDFNPISREMETVEITNYKDKQEQARLVTSLPQKLSFAPINTGQVYYGFATAVTSPFDFYIVLQDSLLIMNKVSAMLEELPSEMPPLPEAHLVPGSCCLVYSKTKGRWCRAEVLHAETTIAVNLVDYGHCIYLAYSSYQQVKILPEALKRLPKVTYPCSLRGVNPVSDTRQWTDEAAVFFQERVCHKDLQILFWEFVSDDRQWEVDVLVEGIHLSKELVEAGHSSYVDILLGLRFQEQHLGNISPLMASSMENSLQEV